MVSTVSQSFCEHHDIDVHPLNNILDIVGAGGHNVPYLGYTEVNVSVSDSLQPLAALLLAVPDTPYNKRIPVIIGTNILPQLLDSLCTEDPSLVSDAWKLAVKCLQCSNTISVKSTRTVTVPAGEKVIFNGMSHVPMSSPVLSMRQMVIEHADHSGLPGNLVLTPGLFNITFAERTCHIPIQVFNTSDRDIIIPANVMIGKLVAVKSVVPISEKNGLVMDSQISVMSQQCSNSNSPVSDNFLSKFDLDEIRRHLSSVQVSEVTNLLENWQMAFSLHDLDLGHITSVKHHIKLTDETPFKQRHRRIPPSQYEAVKKHLQDMLNLGVIRPSESPYASNIVLVSKKDGSLRFCIDLRKLNENTVKDSYALPRIEETLDVLGGSQWFSVLDLKSAYWQVEIAEEDKAKTAFTVGPLGFYECNRMPFGLTNAPATFQRLIETCMSDIYLSQCLLYLDDIVIFSKSYEEHLARLEAVLNRLAASGLKLHPSKCHLFQREIRYLGHIVSASGVATDPEKIKAVQNWPAPTNIDELRRFLGFIGFYRRFIQDFAKIARPLHNLLGGPIKKRRGKQKHKPQPVFHWGQTEQEAFEQLIHRCCTAPVLAYADYNKPFIVHTDASKDGLGAVLYQVQDGIERAVAYASRSLTASEKNYPAHKMEFLALKWSIVDKFHDYLFGNKFLVRTDNNPLTYILTTAKLDATGHRWVSELSNFDFCIKYRPGRQNKDADALSRLPNNCSDTSLLSDDIVSACIQMAEFPVDAFVETTCFSQALASEAAAPVFGVQSLSPAKWQQLQAEDPVIRQVVSVLNETVHSDKLSIEAQKLWRQKEKLTLNKGVLYRQRQSFNGSCVFQLVLPKKYHSEALGCVHDQMGHMGRKRTLDLLTSRFYWTNVSNDVAAYISRCDRCLRRKSLTNQKAPLVNITTSYPLELVSIDYLTLETSKGGFENILVVMDHFTRYAQAYPTRNQTAKTTARVLFDNFICHYGFPARIHSDQGRNFMSKTIEHLCQMAGIDKSRTTPYHAMGNGQVERFNRTLLGMLGTMEPIQKADWKTFVPSLVHAYNCTKQESTEYSPFFLMFGRQPRLPVDLLLGSADDNVDGITYEAYVDSLRDRLRFAYDLAASHVAKAQKSQKQRYDLKARSNRVVIGDRVLIRNVGLQGKNKLADRWKEDVFIVTSQPDPEIPVYEVKPEVGRARKKVLHRNLLLPISSIPVVDSIDVSSVATSDVSSEAGSMGEDTDNGAIGDEQLDTPQTRTPPVVYPVIKPTPAPRYSIPSHNRIPTPIVYSSTEDESSSDSEKSCISNNFSQPPSPKPRRSARLRKLPAWVDPEVYHMKHVIEYANGVFIPYSQ